MLEISIFRYFSFGYNYYLLLHDNEGLSVHGEDSLTIRIDEFFAALDELNLQVTRTAAYPLENIRAKLDQMGTRAKVSRTLAKEVEEAVKKLDATLDAELQLRSAFVVTPKRFQLDHLLSNQAHLFAPSIFEALPSISQFDFKEAARCITFGLPTGAAFHLMRGTEGVLRHYYCAIVKKSRVRTLLWYAMVDHLRKRRDAPPKALTDNLDNIRVNFRNPTQHPDARYDMQEVQDLFALSIDVVNRMTRDIVKRGSHL